MLPRLNQRQLQEPMKHSFRQSKSYTAYRVKTPQIGVVSKPTQPNFRKIRLGSQELTLSRRRGIGTPQRPTSLMKTSRALRQTGSQEMIALRKHRSNFSCNIRRTLHQKKLATQDKQWNADTNLNANHNPVPRLLSAQHRRPQKQTAATDALRLVMDSDYSKYQLQPGKRHLEQQAFDLDRIFRRNYGNMQNFLKMVCFTNDVHFQRRKKRQYEAVIDKGNNSQLVRHILSTRFWWSVVEDKAVLQREDAVQFHWSQKRKLQCLNSIPKCETQQSPPVDYPNTANSKTAKPHIRAQSLVLLQHYQSMVGEEDMETIKASNAIHKGLVRWKEVRPLKTSEQRTKPIEFTHNHLQFGQELGNKKQLFRNIKAYLSAGQRDPFSVLPLTYHVKDITDPAFEQFTCKYMANQLSSHKTSNVWIVKPGENTNRGTGIEVLSTLQSITDHISSTKQRMPDRTFIVQQYINPFLFFKRKFDIRCYLLVTSYGGRLKGYFYQDGYLRTSSKEFSLKRLANKMIHLTNDAIQKKGEEYGKFQRGNKISYSEFQRYLNLFHARRNINFEQQVLPDMKEYAKIALEATCRKLDYAKRAYTFELFGLDYLLDQNLKPWLIEVNSNPCLELSSPLLAALIPSMLENTLRIALDPVFPPPDWSDWQNCHKGSCPSNYLQTNRYELIFDSEPSHKVRHDLPAARYRPTREQLSSSSNSARKDSLKD